MRFGIPWTSEGKQIERLFLFLSVQYGQGDSLHLLVAKHFYGESHRTERQEGRTTRSLLAGIVVEKSSDVGVLVSGEPVGLGIYHRDSLFDSPI